MEATYGDRRHPETIAEEGLAEALNSALRRGGIAMIASFAVGRAQTLAYLIHRLMLDGDLPEVPVFLNSPMAIEVTGVHLDHVAELRPDAAEFRAAMDRLVPTPSVEESKALNERRGPWIVIAGAGMLTGGRILHHLKAFGSDPRNALILPGYQAEGTRGRRLRSGERRVKIHGQTVEIRCQIHVLDQLSAHADAEELADWILDGPEPSGGVVLVHAEPSPADIFRATIEGRVGWKVAVAEEGVSYP
jgi:metallo-beta-lactamase family protein